MLRERPKPREIPERRLIRGLARLRAASSRDFALWEATAQRLAKQKASLAAIAATSSENVTALNIAREIEPSTE